MKKRILLILIFTPSLFALNNRSAVSVNGADTNSCSVASPCRSFSVAVAATNNGGEVLALDSAGYGQVVIDRVLTLSGAPGVHASVTGTSGTAIEVAAPGSVTIRNVVVIAAGGTDGIRNDASTELRIIGCLVRGFTSANISGTGGSFLIHSSTVLDSAGNGIGVGNGQPQGSKHVNIIDSWIAGNNFGVQDSCVHMTIVHSTIYDNNNGAYMTSGSNCEPEVLIERSVIVKNSVGVGGNGDGLGFFNVSLSDNLIAYNTTFGVDAGAPAIHSFGNNQFVANATDVNGAMSPVAFQ